jgi:hypothetical protein
MHKVLLYSEKGTESKDTTAMVRMGVSQNSMCWMLGSQVAVFEDGVVPLEGGAWWEEVKSLEACP